MGESSDALVGRDRASRGCAHWPLFVSRPRAGLTSTLALLRLQLLRPLHTMAVRGVFCDPGAAWTEPSSEGTCCGPLGLSAVAQPKRVTVWKSPLERGTCHLLIFTEDHLSVFLQHIRLTVFRDTENNVPCNLLQCAKGVGQLMYAACSICLCI